MGIYDTYSAEYLRYLELLAKDYPTQAATFTEIINLQAIVNLPKGTEHFMSDLHGEYGAFYHILNNCSGVIREKVEMIFSDKMNKNGTGQSFDPHLLSERKAEYALSRRTGYE